MIKIKENNNKKKLIIAVSVISVLLIAGIAILGGKGEKKAPDMAGKSREEIIDYFKSEDFNDLDHRTKRSFARQIMGEQMRKTAEGYFALPVNQRKAYLDNIIDEMEARRKEFESNPDAMRKMFGGRRPPEGERPEGDNERRPRDGQRRADRRSPEKRRARAEMMDPQSRAVMSEFREAMRQRREERGLSGGPFGR